MPRFLALLFLVIHLCLQPPTSALAQASGKPKPAAATPKPSPPKTAKPAPPKKPPPPPPTGQSLIAALENKDAAKALNLVQRGADPNALIDNRAQSALGLAAGLGDVKLVQALLERGGEVNPSYPDTTAPLVMALDAGSEEIARLLVEKGANVNVGDGSEYERRPLVVAAVNGWLPLVTLLLEKGAEVNHVADDHVTALGAAAEGGHVPVMELLISRGARVAEDKNLMRHAVGGGHVPAVQFLLGKGRSLSETPEGTTLLHMAASSGSIPMMQMVLDAGAAIDAVDADGETPLMMAVQTRDPEAVSFLLGKKARIDPLSYEYKSAFDLARDSAAALGEDEDDPKRKAVVAALTKAGAKPAPKSLWKAAIEGEVQQIKILLDQGADPNELDARKGVPLYYALGHLRSTATGLVSALLNKGANPNAKAPDGRSLVDAARDANDDEVVELLRRAGAETPELDLTEAIERGDEVAMERLLAAGVVPESVTLVHAMERKDNRALLKRLLEKGAKVNTPTRLRGFLFFGGAPDFPLHAAVQTGDVETVRLLLDHGADPNIRKDDDGPTALHEVGGEDKEAIDAIVRLLVERGANVRARGSGIVRGSVLMRLAAVAAPKTLEFLMEKGAAADINLSPSNTEDTAPLTLAARVGNVDNVRLLLDRGADPNPIERLGRTTPLMEVAQDTEPEKPEHNVAIAKLLIERGARLDVTDSIGQNALALALESGNFEIAKLIRAAGSGKATIAPVAAMTRAIFRGDTQTVSRLLQGGYDPNAAPSGGGTLPLYDAAYHGRPQIVRLLLERGADVNAKAMLGTGLHGAAAAGDVGLVRFLLSRGAKVDEDDGFIGTPLARAADEGHIEVMRALLKAGADASARRSEHPGSPLVKAVSKGEAEAVELLLKAGADPNLGYPLRATLWFGGVPAVERLVRAGAKINAQDEAGRTLLMEAAMIGHKDLVTWLIAHKADVNLRDKRGRTALMEALERDKNEVALLLRKAGAK